MAILILAVENFFLVVMIMLFLRVILSWFPMAANNKLGELLYMLTEPILLPVRKLVHRSPLGGPGMIIDFSVIITFILLRLLRTFIISVLMSLM